MDTPLATHWLKYNDGNNIPDKRARLFYVFWGDANYLYDPESSQSYHCKSELNNSLRLVASQASEQNKQTQKPPPVQDKNLVSLGNYNGPLRRN